MVMSAKSGGAMHRYGAVRKKPSIANKQAVRLHVTKIHFDMTLEGVIVRIELEH